LSLLLKILAGFLTVTAAGLSIVYARYPKDAGSLEALIEKADQIMYEVKR
jgi:GGDEF domain-containing protein